MAAAIDEATPDLMVLAGFMRILSAEFVDRYAGRILNIHPSLLPKYPGLHTHRRVLAAHDRVHGATVHFVTAELDGGPPVLQSHVAVQPDDDEATLAARVQVTGAQDLPARGQLVLRRTSALPRTGGPGWTAPPSRSRCCTRRSH